MHSEVIPVHKLRLMRSILYIVRERVTASMELEKKDKTLSTAFSSLGTQLHHLGEVNTMLVHKLQQKNAALATYQTMASSTSPDSPFGSSS